MKTIRASRLPLALICPQSTRHSPDQPAIEGGRAAADLGTAFHAVMASWIQHDRDDSRIEHEAAAPFVDTEELRILCGMAWRMWTTRLADTFPSPVVEDDLSADLDGLTITGHPDVYSIVDGTVRVLDWKTGRADVDHREQMRGYAAILSGGVYDVLAVVVDVRDQIAESWLWTRDEIAEWGRRVAERLAATTYSPGPHCEFCPRRHGDCEPYRQWVGQAVELFSMGVPVLDLGGSLATAVQIARVVERNAKALVEVIRARVVEAGGRLGDLQIVDQEQRPIDAVAAWPVLVDALGADAVIACATLAKGEIERAVKVKSAPRMKAKDWGAMLERLDSVGGLGTKLIQKLEIVKHGDSDETKRIAGPATAAETGE